MGNLADDERIAEIRVVVSLCDSPLGDLCQACWDRTFLLDKMEEAECRGLERAAEIAKTIGCEPCAEHIAAAIRAEAAKLEESR